MDQSWTWLEDYLYVSATYHCFTPPGRRLQVGMGIFTGGTALGEKIAVTGTGDFTVVGAGSVHIRLYDDGPNASSRSSKTATC
ncbi:hypothetical protein CJO75_12680 [Ralstonia solanacearum]|nr:hypothetical protein CJO75_12680 [Ralstonia solanacearum]